MYDLGDPVPLSVTVKDSSGALANAGAVTLTITLPDGSSASPAVTNSSTGVYTATYTPAVAGRFAVRWVATGANACAFSDVFDVRPSAATGLFSLADARAVLNITGTTQDEELRDYVDAVTILIEERVGAVLPRTVSEVVRARDVITLTVTPIVSLTSVTPVLTAGWAVNVANLVFDSATGRVWDYRRSSFANDLYTVVYVAGRQGTVPRNISMAARLLLKHLWKNQQGPTTRPGSQGADPMAAALSGYAVPNAVEQLLEPSYNFDGIA